MGTNEQVKVTVTADTRPYQKSLGQATAATKKLETSTTKASGSAIAGFGKQAAAFAGVGIGAAAATGFLKQSIDAAVQFEDTLAKTRVVFGEASGSIEEFANDSKRAFGLTNGAALDAASTFAVFGKAAGLAGDDLVTFSEELTQRAVDLKSFYGGTVQEAITAVGAAMRGEQEPIRRYGVLLNDVTLKQRALEMGLVDTTKNALTPQNRALAASAELLAQSADAQGDYFRTLDGGANSLNELTVAVDSLKGSIGAGLLPAFTELVQSATFATNAIDAMPDSVRHVFELFGAPFALMWEYNSTVLGWFGDSADDAGNAVTNLGDDAQRAAARIDIFGSSAREGAQSAAELAKATAEAISEMNALIDSQQAAVTSRRDLLGAEDRIRAGMTHTATAAAGSAKAQTAASDATAKAAEKADKARTKATQNTIDGIREVNAAERDAEIERARRRAQRKADARADAQARRDVRDSVATAIATDKAARAGKDIDGDNQTGSVGEAVGNLTDAERKALDKRIEAIRAKHKKATDAQVKAVRDQAKAAKDAATATRTAGAAAAGAAESYEWYSTSLNRNTTEGRQNLDVLDGEIDAIQQVGESVYQASIDAGDGAEIAGRKALRAMTNAREELLTTYGQLGFNIDRVKEYLRKLGATNKTFRTTLKLDVDDTASNAALAKQRAKITANKALAADIAKPPPAAAPAKDRRPKVPAGLPFGGYAYAGGGEIGGSGSRTGDTVPIWASRGEFMVNAAQYAANRDLVQAINAGSGKVAAGGMTIGAVNVTESGTRVRASVIDALAEAAYRNGAVR